MKLVSFNINSIRARLHQLAAINEQLQPDIIGLQETKVSDDEFPVAEIEKAGYQAYFHGQKGHYGVAILSKKSAVKVVKGFANDTESTQKRLITATYSLTNGQQVSIVNGYFPQGENIAHTVKYPAKRKFYQNLQKKLIHEFTPDMPIIVMGDFNIAPDEIDIGIGEDNRHRWLQTGKTSFQPEERQWLKTLTDWGLIDSFRQQYPQQSTYSWFDYRSRGFEKDPRRGLRIDMIFVSRGIASYCVDSGIDYSVRALEKPSDHCPVWSELNLSLI